MSSTYSENTQYPSRPQSITSSIGRQPLSERSASQRNVLPSRLNDKTKGTAPSSKSSPLKQQRQAYDIESDSHYSPARRTNPVLIEIPHDNGNTSDSDEENDDDNAFDLEYAASSYAPTEDNAASFPIPRGHFAELPPLEVVAEEMRKSVDIRPEFGDDGGTEQWSGTSPRLSYSLFPVEANVKAPRLSLASTIGRARSQSTASTASYGLFPHLPLEVDPASIPPVPAVPILLTEISAPAVPTPSQARPRSISTPIMPSNDLTQQSYMLDYVPPPNPEFSNEPPSDSYPTAITSGRAVYPAPRRLQRKRADSQLAQAATYAPRPIPQPRAASAATTQRSTRPRPNMVSGWSGYPGRQGAVSPVVEEDRSRTSHSSHSGHGWRHRNAPGAQTNRPPQRSNGVLPSGFAMQQQQASMASAVPPQAQLTPPPIPDEASIVSLEEMARSLPSLKYSNADSRPSTSGSQKSGRLSLYKWLNDSYTSWAKIYYKNENAFSLEMPPNVMEIAEDGTVRTTPSKRLTQSSTLSSKTFSSLASAVLSIPPTPPVPPQYLQQQQPDMTAIAPGHNAPRRKPAPSSSPSTASSGTPPASGVPRGPPQRLGQYVPETGSAYGASHSAYLPGPTVYGPGMRPYAPQPVPYAPGPGQRGPPPRQYGPPGQPGMRPPPNWRPGPPGQYGPPGPHGPNAFTHGERYRTPSPQQYLGPSANSLPPHMIRDRISPSQRYYTEQPSRSITSAPSTEPDRSYEDNSSNRERAITPEEQSSSISDEDKGDSPGSAGFPEKVFLPRVRPRQHDVEDVQEEDEEPISPVDDSNSLALESKPEEQLPHNAVHQNGHEGVSQTEEVIFDPESPDILPRPGARPATRPNIPEWRPLSYDGSKGVFDQVNRQIVLFCVGFVFPLAWMLAACLSLPSRPEMRQIGSDGFYAETPPMTDLFNTSEVARYQKGRRWRVTNRIMSILGVCIIVIVGACAGVATRH